MVEKIFQCCYTNASQEINGKISSGWQPVAVSENIPPEAYNRCVAYQNANSTIQGAMTDERGNVLNLLEICADGNYAYVIRTQYGLLDRLGRANMFSHAYIFSWNEEQVRTDPNCLLTLDNANFKDNEQEALQGKGELFRTPALTLDRALEEAGISVEAYATLIRCVFAQMTEQKTANPLFVQYDGTEQQMRAILYCIYYGLPYYLRKNLCISSNEVEHTSGKNLIFSEFAKKHMFYVLPQTGENNILQSRTERKIDRLGYVDYFAKSFINVDANSYFRELEKYAVQLGDVSASNELILKIAHFIITGPRPINAKNFTDEELDSRLSDALRSKSIGSVLMEKYIACMLNEVRLRKLYLTEENEINLAERLSGPVVEELSKAGEQYNIYRFSCLSPEDAAEKLSDMGQEEQAHYESMLSKTAEGIAILDCYYADVVLGKQDMTWDVLSHFLDEVPMVKRFPRTTERLDSSAYELYCEALNKQKDVYANYEKYKDVMRKLITPERLGDCERNAKEEYWERVSFHNFSIDDECDYRSMSVNTIRCQRILKFCDVINRIQNSVFKTSVFEDVYNFFEQFELSQNEKDAVVRIVDTVVRKGGNTEPDFRKWLEIVPNVESRELEKCISKLRDVIILGLCRDDGMLYIRCTDIIAYSEMQKEPEVVRRQIAEMLLAYLKKSDKDRSPVSLDLWLVIGKMLYENPFEIFDDVEPAIFAEDPFFVIHYSKEFESLQTYAEEYVKSHGVAAKNIKRFLNEGRQVLKQRNKDVPSVEKRRMHEDIADDLDDEISSEKKNKFMSLFKKK